jgi:hypothetical protein
VVIRYDKICFQSIDSSTPLFHANTYIIVDGEHCLVIDLDSKEESELTAYINEKGLTVDYIFKSSMYAKLQRQSDAAIQLL